MIIYDRDLLSLTDGQMTIEYDHEQKGIVVSCANYDMFYLGGRHDLTALDAVFILNKIASLLHSGDKVVTMDMAKQVTANRAKEGMYLADWPHENVPTKIRMAWESTLLPDEGEIDPEEKEILCQPMDDDAAAAWAMSQLARDILQSDAIATMHRIADKVERGEQVDTSGEEEATEFNRAWIQADDERRARDDFDEIMDEIDPLGQEQKNWGAST